MKRKDHGTGDPPTLSSFHERVLSTSLELRLSCRFFLILFYFDGPGFTVVLSLGQRMDFVMSDCWF